MLKKRVITSVVLFPLLVVAIWFGQPWFTIFVAFLALGAFYEFYNMVAKSRVNPLTIFGLFWTLLFIISPHLDWAFTTPILLASAVILPLCWLLLFRRRNELFARWIWTTTGILYIGWLFSHLVSLRYLDNGRDWAFLTIFTIIGSDTFAYFIGRAIGKHRLAPYISPSKTWEGAIGGILGSIIVSIIMTQILNIPVGYGGAILLGLVISIFGQIGDLVESLLKRNMNVKDSSNFLPGHGGFLDRIDSVVFASVVVYYYLVWAIM